LVHVEIADAHAPRERRVEPRDAMQQRRLAGAVRAGERRDRPGADLEGHVVERAATRGFDDEVLGDDHRFASDRPAPWTSAAAPPERGSPETPAGRTHRPADPSKDRRARQHSVAKPAPPIRRIRPGWQTRTTPNP